ncbi:sugar phosphate isomerase/epimerase family protein [Arthrobacter dokdonensis]|uniref:sugar phosphate isomerase/epimerase family protein n=1 Tax=Arthrobacter dokdonellae TaxID=2211210 RepID=UPI001D13089D|nr:sugar phosphate isomerase/epimerase family protein [Arthrobacter dokdonellae]
MRLAFSTLGCPGLSLAQVVELARSSGATGLELRAAEGEFVHPNISAKERAVVARTLSDAGLTVLALASYVRVCAAPGTGRGATWAVEDALRSAVELAADLGAANVRVFPGAGLDPALGDVVPPRMAEADRLGARRLDAAAGAARDSGVTLLLETHDSHPRGEDVARILAQIDPATPVQVIWDLMHPWRHDEAPQRTAGLLAASLAYAQYKDGRRIPGTNDVALTLPGEGELPLRTMRNLAGGIANARGDDDPWVSLEWERAWHPELPPLADALAALKAVLA